MTPTSEPDDGAPTPHRVPRKRRALLDAALALMASRTFAGARVPEIAGRARVATGTLYRYFPSKEALANELYRECAGAEAAFVNRALDARAEPDEQLERLWQALFAFARDHPEAARFLETHPHEGYLDDESRRVAGWVEAPLRDFVARGQAAGALRPGEPDAWVALLRGAFAGLLRAAGHGSVTLDEALCRESGRAVWAMLRS